MRQEQGQSTTHLWYNRINTTRRNYLEGSEIAHKAVEAASAKMATDIVMLDVRDICTFADYFVLSTAESSRQINAIAEEIELILKREGERPIHREGTADSGWVLLDYGDVVIHTFAAEERQFYNLEELWAAGHTVVRIQ